ncbi:MAG: hypothetical protein CXT73_04630 [Methanobacteriota archaeon]|nr:MAG: hypothetical protein CXT73_04630 [Euryarchaeota archaeon]
MSTFTIIEQNLNMLAIVAAAELEKVNPLLSKMDSAYYKANKAKYEPKELPAKIITATNPLHVKQILGCYGVAVIPLPVNKSVLLKELSETKFYNTANAIYTEQHQVAEPTMGEKLNPSTYKNRKAGDDAQGMLHQYNTPLHTLIQNNEVLRETMRELYGKDLRYLPNRLRICRKFKNEANTLHIESHKLFREDNGKLQLIPGEVATLIGLTGKRRFVFWNMDKADLRPLKAYHEANGSEFTKIDPLFMNQHYGGRRSMINIDCSKQPHLIMWQESTPHEIAHSPSLSLYISPVEAFNHTKITKVTTYQPVEFLGLTYHESNLLAMCYGMGGYEWPSGKKLYQYCHQRAYNIFLPRTKEDYKVNGKMMMRLITTGKVDQHTPAYQAKLKEMGIVLPARAFEKDTPKFVVDLTTMPIAILRDYGYIPRKGDKKEGQ